MNEWPTAVLAQDGGPMAMPTRDAERLVRVLETAASVRRRYQLFVWLQTQVHELLPHTVALCGAYRRPLRDLAFESFHGIVLADETLAALTGTPAAALQVLSRCWLDNRCQPTSVCLEPLATAGAATQPWASLQALGLGHALVHGASRPDRPSEIETLFVFLNSGAAPDPMRGHYLELLLPLLHSVYQRVQSTERQMNQAPARTAAAMPAVGGPPRWRLTQRECQILFWVREGKSNLRIGEQLGISPLTVKNHLQKILRKMGAANRAQAVSLAITAQLLAEPGVEPGGSPPRSRP